MYLLTAEANQFPKAMPNSKYSPMTNDFIFRGAWVYENSRAVMETITSAAVSTRYAPICHEMCGVCPASMRSWAIAISANDGTVMNMPIAIFRSGVTSKNFAING